MDKTFIIAGNFNLIQRTAAGKRVLGIGAVLTALGYRVVYLGIAYPGEESGVSVLDGAMVFSDRYPTGIRGWLNVQAKYNVFLDVVRRVGRENLAGVILYSTPALSLWVTRICRWARKNNRTCLVDVADWIDFSAKGFWYNLVKYLDTNYQKRFAVLHASGIIAISRYLHDYYVAKGKPCLEIPPIFHGRALPGAPSSGVRKFIYTGFPFLIRDREPVSRFKDRLDLTIAAFADVVGQNGNFSFDIFGVTREEYLTVLPQHRLLLERLEGKVRFHGKLPAASVQEALQKSDFSLLIRDDKLMTRAGFPSKVAESISAGVPVVCNLTSNIGDYIRDGFNGVILDDAMPGRSLLRAIAMPGEELDELKRHCREQNPFRDTNFVAPMRQFLETLAADHR